AQAAHALQARFADDPAGEHGSLRVPSDCPVGILHRIPLRAALGRPDEEGAARERRRAGIRPRVEPTAWIGLRFADRTFVDAAPPERAALTLSLAALDDEHWWTSF